MKLRTPAEYIESLKSLDPRIFYRGERIEDVTQHRVADIGAPE